MTQLCGKPMRKLQKVLISFLLTVSFSSCYAPESTKSQIDGLFAKKAQLIDEIADIATDLYPGIQTFAGKGEHKYIRPVLAGICSILEHKDLKLGICVIEQLLDDCAVKGEIRESIILFMAPILTGQINATEIPGIPAPISERLLGKLRELCSVAAEIRYLS
jgi:hypothetical protein